MEYIVDLIYAVFAGAGVMTVVGVHVEDALQWIDGIRIKMMI